MPTLILAPPVAEAELVHRQLTSGRNKPWYVRARVGDEPIDCVVKLPAASENPALGPLPSLLEWIAVALAPHLGVNVPSPYEVRITDEFARAVKEPFRAMALASLGSTFGSSFLGPPMYMPWMKDLPFPGLRPAAANLLAFDAFIHNPDRRVGNANLFVGRENLLAFDHGEAFSFIFPLLLAPDPVTDPLLSMLETHACRAWIRRNGETLERFTASLAQLSDEVFTALLESTPAPWQEGPAAGKLNKIVDVLTRRRDAAAQWLTKVEAWLQK